MILYSNVNQLNDVSPSLRGGDSPTLWWAQKFPQGSLERKHPGDEEPWKNSCCFCSPSQSIFPFLISWRYHSCPFCVCLFPVQALSLLALVKLPQVPWDHLCPEGGYVPGTWFSAGLASLGPWFTWGLFLNMLVLYKVIAGQTDFSWPDYGMQAVSVQWSVMLTECWL